MLEEYYDSKEITISGWVDNGNLYLLTITDRLRYADSVHIGICTAHIYPSVFLNTHYQDIKEISKEIIKYFKIENGPIYFQFLIGNEGIKVNEIACRIGGAYEGDFMPYLTRIDILELMIDLSLGKKIKKERLQEYDLLKNTKWLSVQLFFAETGKIENMSSVDEIVQLPGVIQAGFNFRPGDIIGKIENATERAGYFIVKGENREILKKNLQRVYQHLKICNQSGKNLVLKEYGEL